jgi:hypothetical protein
MAKYHINGRGEPGKCSAQKGGCPFGGEGQHYSTSDDARKAYENDRTSFGNSEKHLVMNSEGSGTSLEGDGKPQETQESFYSVLEARTDLSNAEGDYDTFKEEYDTLEEQLLDADDATDLDWEELDDLQLSIDDAARRIDKAQQKLKGLGVTTAVE